MKSGLPARGTPFHNAMAGLQLLLRRIGIIFLICSLPTLLLCCVASEVNLESDSIPSTTPTKSKGSTPATPEPTESPTQVNVEWPIAGEAEIWHSLSGPDLEFLEEAIVQLSDSYPDLNLSLSFVAPHNLISELLKAILSGEGPQLLVAPASRLPELNAEALVKPFDALREEDLKSLVPSALFGLIHDQKLFGLPLWVETVMLYANTDLIAQNKVPQDTAELMALAQEATSPVLGLYPSLFHLSWGFQAFGGVLFDSEYKVVLDQSVGGSQFLDWLQQADSIPGIDVNTDYNSLLLSFLEGESALFLDGPWTLAAAEDALGNSLSIHEIPAGPFGPARPWLTTEALLLVPGQSQTQEFVSATIAAEMVVLVDEMIGIAHRLPASQLRMQQGSRATGKFRDLLLTTTHMPHVSEMSSVWRLANELLLQTLAAEPSQGGTSVQVSRFALLANEENGK